MCIFLIQLSRYIKKIGVFIGFLKFSFSIIHIHIYKIYHTARASVLSKKMWVLKINHTCFLTQRKYQLSVAVFPTLMGTVVNDQLLVDVFA